jgi:serine/threonine protein kinase
MASISNSIGAVNLNHAGLNSVSSEGKNNNQTDIVQDVALKSLAHQAAALYIQTEDLEDRKIIQEALERFEKEYGHTMQAIMDATIQELAEVRKSGAEIGFGGFKKAGIKKWKFLVTLDDDGKITKLYIGQFHVSGGFTKVYRTLDDKVIMVPRKDKKNSSIEMMMAHGIMQSLHVRYSSIDSFSEEFQKVLTKLGFPVSDFQATIKGLIEVLPPLPNLTMFDNRSIMIAPQATPVRNKFLYAPTGLQDIIDRLGILRDVALCLTLSHGLGLIHGDIKPDNMLFSRMGKGHLSDFGGSLFLTSQTDPDQAVSLFKSMTTTPDHVNYQDRCLKHKFFKNKTTTVAEYARLGKALDVYALGVSTVEALAGLYDSQNVRQAAFTAYQKVEDRSYISGDGNTRRDVTCIRDISPEIDENLNTLLNAALKSDYEERADAKEVVQVLHLIINQLESLPQS